MFCLILSYRPWTGNTISWQHIINSETRENASCQTPSLKFLLRYSTFYILRLSSIEGHLHLKHLLNLIWSHYLKFQIWVRSYQRLLIYTFYILRFSSIGGRLHLKHLLSLVWSPKLKFTSKVISLQLLLRYYTLNILRSSSTGGMSSFEASV